MADVVDKALRGWGWGEREGKAACGFRRFTAPRLTHQSTPSFKPDAKLVKITYESDTNFLMQSAYTYTHPSTTLDTIQGKKNAIRIAFIQRPGLARKENASSHNSYSASPNPNTPPTKGKKDFLLSLSVDLRVLFCAVTLHGHSAQCVKTRESLPSEIRGIFAEPRS